MNNTDQRHRHGLVCGVLTAIAAALVIAWYVLSDLDASTKAAQLGAMIAVVAAAPTASAAWSCRRRSTQDEDDGAALDAVSSRQ